MSILTSIFIAILLLNLRWHSVPDRPVLKCIFLSKLWNAPKSTVLSNNKHCMPPSCFLIPNSFSCRLFAHIEYYLWPNRKRTIWGTYVIIPSSPCLSHTPLLFLYFQGMLIFLRCHYCLFIFVLMFPYYARKLLEKNYQFQLLFILFWWLLESDWYLGTRNNNHIFITRHECLNFITHKKFICKIKGRLVVSIQSKKEESIWIMMNQKSKKARQQEDIDIVWYIIY